MLTNRLLFLAVGCSMVGCGGEDVAVPPGMERQHFRGNAITLPANFRISVFARRVSGIRFMSLGPDGSVYATRMRAGRVVRLLDRDGDWVVDRVVTIADGLDRPHGLAWRGDTLYVAESGRVIRLHRPSNIPEVVIPNLPSGGLHPARSIVFRGGDLFVSVGSSCNVCDEADGRRGSVMRYAVDGRGEVRFATGVRNAVGLDVHPLTGELWATNNGRDGLGDTLPPDRVEILEEGGDYGWPRCYLPYRPNREYGDDIDQCAAAKGPAVLLPAHVAPLGIAFYDGSMFPAAYRGDAFVALHGSWNSTVPVGYKVIRLDVEEGVPTGAWSDFVVGPVEGGGLKGGPWARPVDVLVLPDGSLLISDDMRGMVYRVTYGPR